MTDFSKITRTTHTVRCRSANNQFFADVEVLDGIALTLPNGAQISYKLRAQNPFITDKTGDGNGTAGSTDSTRSSHMQRYTGIANPKMCFDAEVCDAFTITGPNNTQFLVSCPTPWWAAPGTSLIVGTNNIPNPLVTDNTGSGLATSPGNQATRAQHVVKLTKQVYGHQVSSDYLLVYLTDAIVYLGPEGYGMPFGDDIDGSGVPNDKIGAGYTPDSVLPIWGDQHLLLFPNPDTLTNGALTPAVTTNDTTKYVTDPVTGLQVPPDNTDPNIYIYWPGIGNLVNGEVSGAAPSGTPTAGPFLGAGQAVDMGPIWWIRQVGSNVNVWYWYINPVQTPEAWSYFGSSGGGGAGGSWGYRGFTLLPYFPVTWILSENYPLVPLGTYGAATLEDAASVHIIIDNEVAVNWDGLGIPDGGWGVSTIKTTTGSYLGAGLPLLSYTSSTYMPYGAFDLTQGTSAEILSYASLNGINTSIYTDYGGPGPNIWELTGLPQPPLVNLGMSWDPNTNPHQQPSIALAQQVVQTFIANWNSVATALNAAQLVTGGDTVSGGWPFVPPPGWAWSRPYGGDTVGTAQMFSNGWVPAVLPQVTVPAYIPTLAAGQLDDSLWNNQIVLDTNGTSPPVLWATGQP